MSKKKSPILLPEDEGYVQSNLFLTSGVTPAKSSYYPPVSRDIEGFRRVLKNAQGKLGADFEFPPSYKPSVIGISTLSECAAISATPELCREVVDYVRERHIKLVGHSVIGAEIRVLETCGIKTDITEWDDSLLKHYLLNQDFSKAPDKNEDEAGGGLGFMNLWTMMSMVLDVPCHKQCRGKACDEVICPRHDVFGYCAIDAWGSVAGDAKMSEQMLRWQVPEERYTELMELSLIAEQMQRQGIKIDMEWVRTLEEKADELKEKLFPFEGEGKKKVYSQFNPRAADQIKEWFAARNITLKSTEKKEITKVLEKTAEKAGFVLKDEEGKFSLDKLTEAGELPEALDYLYRLYEFKTAGKGLAPWFADKYRDGEDYIHPRFITTGASTSRWSSSRPNFTNIPARGMMSLAKGALVPRDESLDIVHSDASQLELRVCLYLSGVNPDDIGEDAFTWLVQNSGGMFDKAAQIMNDTPRQVAKSISHGGDYLESFKVLTGSDLMRPNIKRDIERGALRVYTKKYMPSLKSDWEYGGGVVAFTGVNISERLFGDKTLENRKKALDILEDVYMARFPMIREWQRKVLEQIESNGYVRSPGGQFLRLYGTHEDNAKMGVAFLGQGVGAYHMGGIMLRFKREMQKIPMLFVHDALSFEVNRDWTDKQVYESISLMGEETFRLPGFKAPFKALRGRNELEYSSKRPETHIPGALRPLKP